MTATIVPCELTLIDARRCVIRHRSFKEEELHVIPSVPNGDVGYGPTPYDTHDPMQTKKRDQVSHGKKQTGQRLPPILILYSYYYGFSCSLSGWKEVSNK